MSANTPGFWILSLEARKSVQPTELLLAPLFNSRIRFLGAHRNTGSPRLVCGVELDLDHDALAHGPCESQLEIGSSCSM